jgi:shikimate kinase
MLNLPDKIALVGLMGSGKTTIGKLFAKAINYQFTDLDLFIEEQEGKSISRIFEEHGRLFFRNLEYNALVLLSQRNSFLLSTGGGAPTIEKNLTLLNNNFFTIHLSIEPQVAAERLFNERVNRPLISACKSLVEVTETMEKITQERIHFYQSAKHTIDVSYLNEEQVVNDLLKYFSENGKNQI